MDAFINKKFALLFLIVILITMHKGFTQPVPPEGMVWEKVEALTDEFDSWDPSKWKKSLWNYGVPVQMLDKNSGVSNGKLWIKATLDEDAERWFETSRVMSKTQIKFPMYTECSMKTAHISAYNTFWTNNGNSENRDEIDICENNSKPSITSQTDERQHTMYSQYFIVVNNSVERAHGNFDNRNLSNDNPLKGVKWNEAYHRLGMWWKDANNVQFYLDGEPAGKVTTSRKFTLSQSIIWDLWTIDETWSGGIANKRDLEDDNINTMYVDWIHTFKLKEDPTTGIDNKKNREFLIYPNPGESMVEIDLNKIDNAKLTIYDYSGKQIGSNRLSNVKTRLDLSAHKKGIYLFSIQTENQHYSQKVILN